MLARSGLVGKKSSRPHLGPSEAIFSMDRKNQKNAKFLPISLGGPMAPIPQHAENTKYVTFLNSAHFPSSSETSIVREHLKSRAKPVVHWQQVLWIPHNLAHNMAGHGPHSATVKQKFGVQKMKKIKILKIQICSAQNVGKVWISRKKILPAPFGAIWGHFFHRPKKSKKY